MKNVLAIVFVVSVASIALSQAPPAVAPVAHPQTWEYKVSDRGGFEPGDWQKKLNDLAKEGWELDAVDEGHYILRRGVGLHMIGGPVFRDL